MNLRDRLQLMPPGSLVPVEWVLEELEHEQGGAAPRETVVDLTVEEVAEMHGRKPSTIRNWLGEGRFPGAYRMRGREWRIPPAALAAFREREASGGKRTRVADAAADPGEWRKHLRSAS